MQDLNNNKTFRDFPCVLARPGPVFYLKIRSGPAKWHAVFPREKRAEKQIMLHLFQKSI